MSRQYSWLSCAANFVAPGGFGATPPGSSLSSRRFFTPHALRSRNDEFPQTGSKEEENQVNAQTIRKCCRLIMRNRVLLAG